MADPTLPERDDVRRSILPIPDRVQVGLTTYDAKDPDTSYPPIEPVRPPEEAPNVLVVLLDDVGFGLCETGGVGRDIGSPVCDDYPAMDNAFTGTIGWVRLDISTDSHDHMLDAGQHIRLAMSKQ